jgi:hypothetical protein
LNKTISHEEIKIVIEHLMPISQDDKIEQKTINNIASIIIAILNSSPNNEINEIATKLFEYVNHNMKSHVMSQCFINEKSQKIKEELFKHININDPITLNKIIKDTTKQVKNDQEHFQQLCLFFLDKLKSKTISIENDLFYYNNQENNDNNEEDDNSLNNFKLYNLFNRELQLFESKNNNMYLNTDYYTQTMTTINNINTIISSQLNEFQINCIVQKPNLFKQKLLYINIKPQNEIDKYVDSIVNLSKNKQINEYPQDTEIYQLTLNYLTNKGMNKTNVKTELEKIFSKNIIDDLFMFLFSENQIKNLNVEVNKFCTYYHNHQQ